MAGKGRTAKKMFSALILDAKALKTRLAQVYLSQGKRKNKDRKYVNTQATQRRRT